MTNEEAAVMLERMKNYFLPTSPMLEERREITAIDLAISALSKQSASSDQVDYKAQVKILADVLTDSPLDLPCNLLWRPSGWCKEHCKDGQDSPDAECWMRYARVMTENKTESDEGPKLFGNRTIIDPGEQFIGENLLKEALDQNADSGKTIVLKKRTITERLIIAESLINSVIADSDQFREVTKKTEDGTDTNVGKIPYKKPEIIHCGDCIWYGKSHYCGANYPAPDDFCSWAERRNDE